MDSTAGLAPRAPAAEPQPLQRSSGIPGGRSRRDGFAREVEPGIDEGAFAVENIHCGGCVARAEGLLRERSGVVSARVNLTTRRATVRWRSDAWDASGIAAILTQAGYPARPFRAAEAQGSSNAHESRLLLALGVAGFAASNIMIFSVAVWWGLVSDMDAATQGLFHWASALIALPAVAYAGQPFFRSALQALRARRLNMDVPISLAILLATGMSLYQTTRGSEQVYFDAAVTLLFFLLIGRYLDAIVRRRAHDTARNLLALRSDAATLVLPDGTRRTVAADELNPGDIVAVAAGERIPVDGVIREGITEIDASLITGETVPEPGAPGTRLFAGALNLSAPIQVETRATGDATLLAEFARLIETAEQGRARYVRLADRVARFYSPGVHLLGLLTFTGWMIAGIGWEEALTRAIAVLIITCPCALALAVPAAQVAAAGRLFRAGILLKSDDALERIAAADCVAMDKTGTLTLGRPRLVDATEIEPSTLSRAAGLAQISRHPLSGALVQAAEARLGPIAAAKGGREIPGCGLELDGDVRLGAAAWLGIDTTGGAALELWYSEPGRAPVRFLFEDELRPDAADTVSRLRAMGLPVELLSGDRAPAVAAAAEGAGIPDWLAGLKPADKIGRLEKLLADGRKPLMVGDGLNDAPALAAAHASISPSTAADISQTAADIVFQGERLGAVVETVSVARRTRDVIFQNFALAFGYNLVFVPLAVAGHVTPLIAAIAMSSSSIGVTLNAARLRRS